MPELPEAETIARGIARRVTGAVIARTRILHADVVEPGPHRFARALKRRRITGVGRRGKSVVLELDDGARLLVGLGMTGGLFPLARGRRNPDITHPAVRFHLDGRGQLVYHDIRRFGRLRVLAPDAWQEWSAALGPEPLGAVFTAAMLSQGLARSRTPVRNWLLDQRRVAGVGNIYASEALFRASVHPRRPAASLNRDEAARLYRALRAVLREAIEARGTTIRDYSDADGEGGDFAPRLRVYGRDGEPCARCGTEIRRVVFTNRSAFLCPACQVPE